MQRALRSPADRVQRSSMQTKKWGPALGPVLLILSLGCGSSDRGLYLFDDRCKTRLIEHCHVSQYLAIKPDFCFGQPVHENAVAQPVLAHRGVDTRDPQRAKRSFLVAAIAVSILPRLHHRFFGNAENVLAAAREADSLR